MYEWYSTYSLLLILLLLPLHTINRYPHHLFVYHYNIPIFFYAYTIYIGILFVVVWVCISWSALHFQMRRKGPDSSQLIVFSTTLPTYDDVLQQGGDKGGGETAPLATMIEEEFEL